MKKGFSEFAVSRMGKGGLSRQEISEVLATLKLAKAKGEIPPLTYEASSHSRLFGKDPIYLSPKSADLKRTAVKVRMLLRRKFGDKYSVYLV